ncbi:T9SS type A sorting domain-containing protein, partial [Candidatus Latescibacterota bacterium]
SYHLHYQLDDAEGETLTLEALYSIDGGKIFTPAAVTGTLTEIGKDNYSGTLIWNTEEDLSKFFGLVVFSLTPYDKGKGTSGNILIWVDNYGECRVAVGVPEGEQASDIDVNFEITDPNSRNVTLNVEYSKDNGDTWMKATIAGEISGIDSDNYTGSFVWKSEIDLMGYEGKVELRVIPNNGLDGILDLKEVYVDYNRPPVISVEDITGEQTGEIPISYTVADNEDDTIDVKLECSIDSGSGYKTAKLSENGWDSINDLGYCYQQKIYLRLTPFDKDQGESVVVGPFIVTNLAGDYKRNLVIDGDDLLEFSDAWYAQDTTKEIGPVTGVPPNLNVNPDSVVDFEDLTVFAWMWQWYTEHGSKKKAFDIIVTKAVADESEAWDGIHLVPGENGVCSVVCDERLNFLNLLIKIDGSSHGVTIHGSDYWTGDGNGIVLTRMYEDGLIEFAAVYLGDNRQINTNNPQILALLNLSENEDIEKITVKYKARIYGEQDVILGVTTASNKNLFKKPTEFALYQNKPNPFNPMTTIDYSLPINSHVKLIIYNVTGQQVSVLKDGVDGKGNHSVTWNASDMPSGIYFYVLESGELIKKRKMLLLK